MFESRTFSPNPFSASRIRPGAIPFIFTTPKEWEHLLARIGACNYWGEIVGQHGTGKSTLLLQIGEHLKSCGQRARRFRASRRGWLATARQLSRHRESVDVVLLDEFDSLPWIGRRQVVSLLRRNRAGLILSSHRTHGLPTLLRTSTNTRLARHVVESLLSQREHLQEAELKSTYRPPTEECLTALLDKHDGNMREVLFDLYDQFEAITRP